MTMYVNLDRSGRPPSASVDIMLLNFDQATLLFGSEARVLYVVMEQTSVRLVVTYVSSEMYLFGGFVRATNLT